MADIDIDQEGLPSTDTERALVPLWGEVLSLKTVDVQESFFDLGGWASEYNPLGNTDVVKQTFCSAVFSGY